MFVVYARCFASHVLASKFISTRVDTLGVLDLCNNSGPDLYHFCKHVSHFAHLITTMFVVYARCHATFQVRSGTQHDMQKCILDAKSISEMSHFVYMQMEHSHPHVYECHDMLPHSHAVGVHALCVYTL